MWPEGARVCCAYLKVGEYGTTDFLFCSLDSNKKNDRIIQEVNIIMKSWRFTEYGIITIEMIQIFFGGIIPSYKYYSSILRYFRSGEIKQWH